MSDNKNPFSPIEFWDDTVVKMKDGDREKIVDAKHYHVRYIVGESEDRRFVDSGGTEISVVNGRTLYTAPAIHRVPGQEFHYDVSAIREISLERDDDGNIRRLVREGQCQEHPLIEVSFQSPGVECCAMTKEEADRQQVPVQYMSGYLLGRSNGLFKIALIKTVLTSGETFYENIHIIPENIVKDWSCLA